MHPLVRGAPPDCLQVNREGWTQRWIARAADGLSFHWPSKPCYESVRTALLQASAMHCAFCDGYPLDPATIEHFKPKSVYHDEAYEWTNLYPACVGCQNAKRERFDLDVLRPDELGYSFERYFEVSLEFNIIPNPLAGEADNRRATATIDTYRLNRGALIRARQELFRGGSPPTSVYRFIGGSFGE